ncbi:MAG: tyrosine-type recombinase/integrase [Arenicella sp.]
MITDIQLKNAKPKDKDYTINVDTGLTLLIKATGSKLWRFRYSYLSKRNMISIGKYPQISIKEARTQLEQYQDLLSQGINPATHKKIKVAEKKTEKTFKEVALLWHKKKYKGIDSRYNNLVIARLENHAFPAIGNMPIKSIDAPMMYNLIESIQETGKVQTGKRVNGICSMVFRHGVVKGYCSRDVTMDYKGLLETAKSNHLPTLTDTAEIAEFLQDIRDYKGKIISKIALQISPYVFLRPSELAISKWEFIDFEKSHWLIPAQHMKMNRDHLIPFPSQVKKLLKSLHVITGGSEYIFPSEKDNTKTMHSETVNKAIRRIDDGKYIGRMVSHGFRGMASTILNENKFRSDVIERQLAHVENNQVRSAYNHAEYLEERTEMMQWYADYLDSLKATS